MNYFLRAFWVIFSGLFVAIIFNLNRIKNVFKLIHVSSEKNKILGWCLLIKFDINSYYFSLILIEMQKKITFNTLLFLEYSLNY